MHLFTATGTALAVALTTAGLAPAAQAETLAASVPAAAAFTIPKPPTKLLPVAVDVPTQYQGQTSCDPRPKPGVTAFNALMKARYKTGGVGIYRPCQGDTSEHYDGRAVDWMLNVRDPRQKAIANSVTAWLSARGGVMARRFGISYIIWNKRVFKGYRSEAGWTKYTGSVPHTDHIHISFAWDGAMKRTSWWTGKANTVVDQGPCRVYRGQFAPLYRAKRTTPCAERLLAAPYSRYSVFVYGQRNAQIAVAQRKLGVTPNGVFGPGTFTKLRAWQARARVPITGVLDKATWAKMVRTAAPAPGASRSAAPRVSLPASATRYTAYKLVVLRQGARGPAVVALQRALRITADGAFGPMTRVAVLDFQTRSNLVRTGAAGRGVWARLEKRDYPLIAYRGLRLRPGSAGGVVVLVQRLLQVPATGSYNPGMGRAVQALQARVGLGRTGVVSGWTWVAVENLMRR